MWAFGRSLEGESELIQLQAAIPAFEYAGGVKAQPVKSFNQPACRFFRGERGLRPTHLRVHPTRVINANGDVIGFQI